MLQRVAVSSFYKVVTVILRGHDKPSFRKSKIIGRLSYAYSEVKPVLDKGKADDACVLQGIPRAVLPLEHTFK